MPASRDGRRALEQALLFAAAVPLRASADAAALPEDRLDRVDRTTTERPDPTDLRRTADVTAICPVDVEDDQQSLSASSSLVVRTDSGK